MGIDWESIMGEEEYDREYSGYNNPNDWLFTDYNDSYYHEEPSDEEFYAAQAQMELEERGLMKGEIDGEEVILRDEWGNHKFTYEEELKLFKGEEIEFDYTDKSNKEHRVKGKLVKCFFTGTQLWWIFVSSLSYNLIKGDFKGEPIAFKNSWSDHTLTEEEIKALFDGKEIEFDFTDSKQNTHHAKGKLVKYFFDGSKLRWTLVTAQSYDFVKGMFNGEQITIKRTWGGHTFTEEEIKALFDGKEIEFDFTDKKQNTHHAKGKLVKRFFDGSKLRWKFVNSQFYDYIKGTFNGEQITIKRTWGGHTFTEEEIKALFDGEEIEIDYLDKKGVQRTAKGKLGKSDFNGTEYWGFAPDFQLKKS